MRSDAHVSRRVPRVLPGEQPLEAQLLDAIARRARNRSPASFVFRELQATVVPPYAPRTHPPRRKVTHGTRPTGGFLGRSGAPDNCLFTILETTRRVDHFRKVR